MNNRLEFERQHNLSEAVEVSEDFRECFSIPKSELIGLGFVYNENRQLWEKVETAEVCDG